MSVSQRTLFDREDLVEVPRARRDGPSTSMDAARQAGDLAHAHRALVLAALRHGPASAEEIATLRLGGSLSTLQVMKRASELLHARLIAVHDEAGTTASGRRCRRYRLAGNAEVQR